MTEGARSTSVIHRSQVRLIKKAPSPSFPVDRMRRCTIANSSSMIWRNASRVSERKTITLSSRFMNSGENLRRAASMPIFSNRSPHPSLGAHGSSTA